VRSHLAFYRAAIAAVTDHDPYAGLLLSMHGAGIYNGRYGTNPELRLTFAPEVQELVDAFVAEQEGGFAGRAATVGVDDEARWRDYGLLQLWDRLSISFCLKDHQAGAPDEVMGHRLEPRGPWRVAIDPYPFGESPVELTLLRRLVPKRDWADDDDFRADFWATPVEPLRIVAERLV
jgi:hypothetical protein